MKNFLKLILISTLVLSFINANDSLSGREIIDESSKRHDASFEFEVQKMELIDKKNNIETRELRRYSRKGEEDLFKYLLIFDKPAGVKGVALLTWQNKDKDDDQWMYLPGLKKVKRIAKGGNKNYFMGTDYAFEDLVSENKNKFKYTRIADEVVDGQDCYVIEVYPNTKQMKKATGYKYRKLFVRKDLFFTVKIDYFDKRGRFFKQQILSDLVQIKGDMYRAKKSLMINDKENHTTRITALSRDLSEKSVPIELFKQRYIKSARHMK